METRLTVMPRILSSGNSVCLLQAVVAHSDFWQLLFGSNITHLVTTGGLIHIHVF